MIPDYLPITLLKLLAFCSGVYSLPRDLFTYTGICDLYNKADFYKRMRYYHHFYFVNNETKIKLVKDLLRFIC